MSISSLLIRGLKSGHWAWGEDNTLRFVSTYPEKKRRKLKKIKTSKAINGLTYATLKVDIKFRFSVSEMELMHFRHYLKERNKNRTDAVVTIEDVKIVAIYLCSTKLPAIFHQFYSLLKINQLLRACIVYMEFYLQTCESLIKTQGFLSARTEERSIHHKNMQDLDDLRVLIGRFYAGIIFAELGKGSASKISRTDEILLFEYFLRVSTIAIWIALERKYLNAIKIEIGRIFRTDNFSNLCRVKGSNLVDEVDGKKQFVLKGRMPGENPRERKPNRLISKSPVIKSFLEMREPELVMITKNDVESFPIQPLILPLLLVTIAKAAILKHDRRDERLKFLVKYIFVPEKDIREEGIVIGILGYHRRLFDPLLYPCTKRNLKLLITGSPMDISEDRKKLREIADERSLKESEPQDLHHFDQLPKIPFRTG